VRNRIKRRLREAARRLASTLQPGHRAWVHRSSLDGRTERRTRTLDAARPVEARGRARWRAGQRGATPGQRGRGGVRQ
jgi:hypothetical protein